MPDETLKRKIESHFLDVHKLLENYLELQDRIFKKNKSILSIFKPINFEKEYIEAEIIGSNLKSKLSSLQNENTILGNKKFASGFKELIQYCSSLNVSFECFIEILSLLNNKSKGEKSTKSEYLKLLGNLKVHEKNYMAIGESINSFYKEITTSDASLEKSFDYWTNFWLSIAKEVLDVEINNAILSEQDKIRVGRICHKKFTNIWKYYIDIVVGRETHQISEAVCYNRLLRDVPSSKLTIDVKSELDRIVNETFHLGVFTHLFIFTFPTRENIKNIDEKDIVNNWLIESVAPSHALGDVHPQIIGIFEHLFLNNISEYLSKWLSLDPINLGKHQAFLRELYLAPILLGMQYDIATKN